MLAGDAVAGSASEFRVLLYKASVAGIIVFAQELGATLDSALLALVSRCVDTHVLKRQC